MALAEFFDLKGAISGSAAERKTEGLKILGARNASAEYKQAVIRDARYALARAIRHTKKVGFRSRPSKDDPFDATRRPQDDDVKLVFDELLVLRAGRGVSPRRIEDEAPTISALPGTRGELVLMRDKTHIGEAAIRFLGCAVSTPRMAVRDSGHLVVASLNLSSLTSLHGQRIAEWMDTYDVEDEDEFEAREEWALARFADLISTLDSSPCASLDEISRGRSLAEKIFGTLSVITEHEGPATAESLYFLIEEALPSIGRSGTFAPMKGASIKDWVTTLLSRTGDELEIWLDQYRQRFMPTFLPVHANVVRDYIAHMVLVDTPAQALRATARAASEYRAALPIDLSADELEQYPPVTPDWSVERHALHVSLGVLAQMLAFHEVRGSWDRALNAKWQDAYYTPPLPLIAVADLEAQEAGRRH